ncbi:MAG: hypothetical protein ACI89J_002627, partial [Hyphomicrobiaceae bacterium]
HHLSIPSRDFVPWRFSDASKRDSITTLTSARLRNLHISRLEQVQHALIKSSMLSRKSGRGHMSSYCNAQTSLCPQSGLDIALYVGQIQAAAHVILQLDAFAVC